MIAVILDAGTPASCQPLTCTRPLAACPVANLPLLEAQKQQVAAVGLVCMGTTAAFAASAAAAAASPPSAAGRQTVAELSTIPRDEASTHPRLFLRGDAWVPAAVLSELARVAAAASAIRAADGTALAWLGTLPVPPAHSSAQDVQHADAFLIRYPWDLLRVNELLVRALTEDRIEGEVCKGVTIEGHIVLGRGSRLLPGVYIEGNAIIGCNCKIGPNCYIRGSTAIGDNCHIGQAVEVKNSILMTGAAIGHLSYCGDSIVGEKTNFGAGTITANYRHDGKNHRSLVGGQLLDTGRRKFGAIIGDDVHTGIHTSIYPGRKLWPHTSTRPGAVVQKDLVEGEA